MFSCAKQSKKQTRNIEIEGDLKNFISVKYNDRKQVFLSGTPVINYNSQQGIVIFNEADHKEDLFRLIHHYKGQTFP